MNQNHIRNFCIISHVDHGKSTLADRFLELTGTVERRKMKDQVLDTMELERERGITIKLQPVRMTHKLEAKSYQLNLIDTPGHVDFTYEVSRSLAACEGAILVVDATQGIQAQTLANVNLALEHNLVIIPVINKIDLPNAEPEATALEIKEAFGFKDDAILFVSAKTGKGVERILKSIIKRIPPPKGSSSEPFKSLIFDSEYDKHRGVIAFVRVVSGRIEPNQKIKMMGTGAEAQSLEVGYFSPQYVRADSLETGEVGYVVTNLRELENARVGDTITLHAISADSALPGYKAIKPMVYASIFPASGDAYPELRDAMEKLRLNDAALTSEPEHIPAIGFGFRCGFLGLLHMDVIAERLRREFDLELVITAPSVSYQATKKGGKQQVVYTASDLPDPSELEDIAEPWVRLDVVTPERFLGSIMELLSKRRGEHKSTDYLGPGRLNLHFEVPLSNVISGFYDKLKSVTSGYGSMNYEFLDWREADLVKLDILVAGEKVEPLSMIVHQSTAEREGRSVVERLKDIIPKQQFAVALQAAIGAKIVARETLPALRKDVTAKLYGGDVTRKMKLLKKQKKGKARLKKFGKVEIPQEAFLATMRR